jgi:hypothetical protein
MNPDEPDSVSTQVLRRAVLNLGRDTLVAYWKSIVAAVAGFVLGVATLKIELADALSTARDAKEATQELRKAIDQLATEREVRDTNQRIDDIVSLLSHAEQVAKEPPNGKQHQPSKPRK